MQAGAPLGVKAKAEGSAPAGALGASAGALASLVKRKMVGEHMGCEAGGPYFSSHCRAALLGVKEKAAFFAGGGARGRFEGGGSPNSRSLTAEAENLSRTE